LIILNKNVNIFIVGDDKMNAKTKVMIPNILTASRLVLTPIIIILGNLKLYTLTIILIIIGAITDLFDGKLARKFNTVTEFGAKLDAVSDKVFAIGLIACLISKFKLFIVLLIFEILIGLFNLYAYKKTNNIKSLRIGKIKTTFLFITVVIGFLMVFFNLFKGLINGFIIATINLQILSFISYVIYFYDCNKNKEIEESIINDKTNTRVKIYDIEKEEKKEELDSDTKVLQNIKDIFIDKN
jgi:CDP-diacylglycerol--glycerol-3-phosphate 3-phosphatidyltransferase